MVQELDSDAVDEQLAPTDELVDKFVALDDIHEVANKALAESELMDAVLVGMEYYFEPEDMEHYLAPEDTEHYAVVDNLVVLVDLAAVRIPINQ